MQKIDKFIKDSVFVFAKIKEFLAPYMPALFRVGIYLILTTSLAYLSTGSFFGTSFSAKVPIGMEGFCKIENEKERSCYIKYGDEEFDKNIVTISKPIDGMIEKYNRLSILQLPIGLFDKKICFDIEQPNHFIESVEVRFNAKGDPVMIRDGDCIDLIRLGEIVLKIDKPSINNLLINFNDVSFNSVMQYGLQNFKEGTFEKASDLNSVVLISIKIKANILIIYLLLLIFAGNIIICCVEMQKFFKKGFST